MPKRRRIQTADDEWDLTPEIIASIAAGRRDIAAGRTYTTAEVIRELGLDEAAFRKAARKQRKERSRAKARRNK